MRSRLLNFNPSSRRLRFEHLEERRLLAVSLSFRAGNTAEAPLADAAYSGETAYVRVDHASLADGMVQVGVWEDDGAGDDLVATIEVHVQNGLGFAPWVTTWQGNDDVGPFNRYYLFAASSSTYSGASGAGHFLVRPPVQNTLSGAARDAGGASSAVVIDRVDSAEPIQPGVATWIVTHGFNSSAAEPWVASMTTAIEAAGAAAWQVLTIDWSAGASSGLTPYWVKPVGIWAANVLADYGFETLDVSLIGHSWGSYVMDELAEAMPGGVNVLVGLDPGAIPGSYSAAEVDFAAHSRWSVAFHSSDWWGHEDTPTTADAAFAVEVDGDGLFNFHAHQSIHELFTYMIGAPAGGVSRLFGLDRLLQGEAGAWIANRYDYDGTVGGNYEAVIATVGNQGLVPRSITYIANGSGQPRTIFESDFLGDYNYDDVVNAADYIIWRNTQGSLHDMRADGSGNGVIDRDDYLVWKTHYGKSSPEAANGTGAGAVNLAASAPRDADSPTSGPLHAARTDALEAAQAAPATVFAVSANWFAALAAPLAGRDDVHLRLTRRQNAAAFVPVDRALLPWQPAGTNPNDSELARRSRVPHPETVQKAATAGPTWSSVDMAFGELATTPSASRHLQRRR